MQQLYQNLNISKIHQITHFFPILWLGSISLGPTIESIFFILTLISLILFPNAWTTLKRNLNEKWYQLLIVLIAWTCLSLFWTPKINHEALSYIKRLFEILIIPLIMVLFKNEKQKNLSIKSFILLALIPCCISFIKYFYQINWHQVDDPGDVFYNHILTGFFASFAAYLALETFLKERQPLFFMSWVILSIQVIAINSGRTSLILYTVLMIYSLWFQIPQKYRYSGLIISLISIVAIILLTPNGQIRLHSVFQEIHQFQIGDKAHSIGFRIQFYLFALKLFKAHYWIGNGAGSYTYWFETLNPVPEWDHGPNCHSQYLLALCEEGLIGFSLWCFFILFLFKKAKEVNTIYSKHFIALLMILIISALTDNIFFAPPMYIFLAFAAMSLKKY